MLPPVPEENPSRIVMFASTTLAPPATSKTRLRPAPETLVCRAPAPEMTMSDDNGSGPADRRPS